MPTGLADARRARAGQRRALQQPGLRPECPGHRRIDCDRQFLRADAPGRRHRARACWCRRPPANGACRRGRSRVENGVLRHAGHRHGKGASANSPPPPRSCRRPTRRGATEGPVAFRLIGREGAVKKLDVPAKTNGTARYSPSTSSEPEHAHRRWWRIRRASARKVASFDAAEALRRARASSMSGRCRRGVAVYAESTWPAIKAREELQITWDESAAEKRGSEQIIDEYRAARAQTPGVVAATHGDADAALRRGRARDRSGIRLPLSGACADGAAGRLPALGRRGAPRRVSDAQIQTPDQHAIATVLGLKPEQVAIETMLAGGSFGRRGEMESRFRAPSLRRWRRRSGPGRPVKLMWTREDDVQGGRYRPIFVHRLRGAIARRQGRGLDQHRRRPVLHQGHAVRVLRLSRTASTRSWSRARASCPTPSTTSAATCTSRGRRADAVVALGRLTRTPAIAVECFVDELLQHAGRTRSRAAWRCSGTPRAWRACSRAVAELADWAGPAAGSGRARGRRGRQGLRHLCRAYRRGVDGRERRAAGAQGVVRGRLRRRGQPRRRPRADGRRHRLRPGPRACTARSRWRRAAACSATSTPTARCASTRCRRSR